MAQTTFAYKVRDTEGKLLEGTLEANDQALVAKRLRQMGYTPINIEAQTAASKAMKKDLHLPGLGERVPLKVLAIFSRQFSTLINAGLTLLRALSILEEQTEHAALAKVVTDVRLQVERGVSLSQAMGAHPKAFGRLYIAMVKAGEVSGGLDKSLLSLAETMEKQVALRGKIKSAMAYPSVAFCLVILIAAAILLFIVPQFKSIYSTLGGQLPAPTRLLESLSAITVKFFPFLLLALVLVVIGVRQFLKTPQGREIWDTARLKLPVFGPLMRKTALSRFSSTLSALLRAGVPIIESLDITSETVGNVVVAKGITTIINGVKNGEAITRGLEQHPVFPTMINQMMAVGEETGALDDMLAKAASFLDGEIERTVDSLTSLLEPVMIVVLGAVVGSMVIALYMPMFNIAKLVNAGGG